VVVKTPLERMYEYCVQKRVFPSEVLGPVPWAQDLKFQNYKSNSGLVLVVKYDEGTNTFGFTLEFPDTKLVLKKSSVYAGLPDAYWQKEVDAYLELLMES